MEFLHQEFDLHGDDVVEVTLDHAANVLLLDPSNYLAYQQRRSYRYHGGYITTVRSAFEPLTPANGI